MKKQDPFKFVMRNLRRVWNYATLSEKDMANDPMVHFDQWMQDAVNKEQFEPNAMSLATASLQGAPTVRTVLLKDYDQEGFVFYTNYHSRKGRALSSNPQASAVFYWASLSRQVLIDGRVKQVDRQTSVDYFHSRPRASQIAAYISAQSELVESREILEKRVKEVEIEFKGRDIPCPEHWGGYCLIPHRIEFWQGRPDRLHDRVCFTLNDQQIWDKTRLAP